jgi:carboxylesterase type B
VNNLDRLRANWRSEYRKLPRWPSFTAEDRPTMIFNGQSAVVNDPIGKERAAMFAAIDWS